MKENEQECRNSQQSIKTDQSGGAAPIIIDIKSDQSLQQSLSNNEIQEEPTIFIDKLTSTAADDLVYLKIPKVIAVSSSAETLTGKFFLSIL